MPRIRKFSCLFVALASLALLTASGCQQKSSSTATSGGGDEHGHENAGHEHPETYAGAMEEIQELSSTILASFEAGTAEEAHDALHEIAHLIEELPDLATKAGIEGEPLANVKQHVTSAFDAFDKLDESLHTKAEDAEKISVSDIRGEVEASLAALAKHAPHDHDEHGHDEGADHDHDEHAHDEGADHDHDGADHDHAAGDEGKPE